MNFFALGANHQVLQISCATIHTEDDPTHLLTPPSGYFFIAKIWDRAYFSELGVLSNSEVSLDQEADSGTNENEFVVCASIVLNNWERQPFGKISFSRELRSIRIYHKHSTLMSMVVIATFLLIFILFYLTTRIMVSKPLKLVTNILKTEDPLLIGKLKKSVGEFKLIGQLFSDFLEQKKLLIETKDKAQESDRLKSAFLANLSHEIRTPMNGILGFAELLKLPSLSGDEQQRYISIIENSGQRMLNIINNLVDISKIEAREVALHNTETNIHELLDYLYSFFKPEMDKKGLQFVFNVKPLFYPLILNTDKEKLYAILANLIKNALKYTPSGTVEMGATTTGETIEFYVKDTGIGIPRDRQQAIFERFVQADIEDTNAMEGAGLGLAISKAYAEMLGGTIYVLSDTGMGSTFYLKMPANQPCQPVTEGLANPPADNKKHMLLPKGFSILIAEDDETTDLFLSEIFKDECENIFHASNGIETVEIVKNNPDIDLVIMDIKMPGVNGYEATRMIRDFNSNVIIIAQTAFAHPDDRTRALEAGCNDYLSKPFTKNTLFDMIQKIRRNSKTE
mgnify:FL=1